MTRADVADAVAAFVAAYLATLPDATRLTPDQLAAALKSTLAELRKGRISSVWTWCRWLRAGATVSAAAFSAYTNPWLARAVLAAVWTAARVVCGME